MPRPCDRHESRFVKTRHEKATLAPGAVTLVRGHRVFPQSAALSERCFARAFQGAHFTIGPIPGP